MAEQMDFGRPNYGGILTFEQLDAEVEKHRGYLENEVRAQLRVKGEKAAANREFNEHLEGISNRLDHEIGVLDALEDKRKALIDAQKQPPLPFDQAAPDAPPPAPEEPAGAPIEVKEVTNATGTPALRLVGKVEEPQDAEFVPSGGALSEEGGPDDLAVEEPDDGSLPFDETELGMLANNEDDLAAVTYATRTGMPEDDARAEITAWRAAQKTPAEFVAPPPEEPPARAPRGRRRG